MQFMPLDLSGRASMENNQVVFFTQLYYPDQAATALIMADLAEDLVSCGMRVGVACAQPIYLLKERCLKVEVHNGVSIRRLWTFVFDKNQNMGRFLNGISCFVSMLCPLFSTDSNAILVFNTNPALLSVLGIIAKKVRKQRYYVLVHDLWPELPANIGMIREGSSTYRMINFLMTAALRHANGVVALSESMRKKVLAKAPELEGSIHIIPNWADNARIYPVPKENNTLFSELGLNGKKVVMYSGNLGRYQPIEVMIEAARIMQERKDILFLFAGSGGKRRKLENMANDMKLDNVSFISFQPIERLAESLSLADISLVGLYPANEGVVMPSKLPGLLAVGKPIISVSGSSSDVAKIVAEAGAGLHSSVDDPKELAANILAIVDDPGRAARMGKNGRRYFLEHFERKKITRQWFEMLWNGQTGKSLD